MTRATQFEAVLSPAAVIRRKSHLLAPSVLELCASIFSHDYHNTIKCCLQSKLLESDNSTRLKNS